MSENDARMAAYRVVLEDLKKRKTAIEAAIAGITSLMGESEPTYRPACRLPLPKAKSLVTSSLVICRSDVNRSRPTYLEMVKEPQSTAEIAEALERGGYPTKSRNFRNTVRSVLDRHAKTVGEIVKVQKNWGLAEWSRDGGEL